MVNEQLIQAGIALSNVILQNTFSVVSDKIKSAKANKDKDAAIGELEQIINQLMQDKLELERIAQQYKAEVERITISDDDISHLHNTVRRVLDIMPMFGKDFPSDITDPLLELLHPDTLKALQLLGFNYKEAIGQPFTELLANNIRNAGKKVPEKQNDYMEDEDEENY